MSENVAQNGLLTRVEGVVGADLREVERIFFNEVESFQAYVTDVLGHVTRFRGKRLRPILVLLSATATGGINRDHKILAAVVEMIHTATLLHDDVLDEAGIRRHVATVNARWDNETSVLFGDYLLSHSFHLLGNLETMDAYRIISRTTNAICEGELSQVYERGNFDLTEDFYMGIIRAKTAELYALSCLLGAQFAGADPEVVEALEQYGRSLGIAFQIADDLLDLVGTEAEMGKSLGTDLEKQKLTLPLIRLLDQLQEPEATQVRELLAHPDDQTRAALVPYLEASDAIEYARTRAEEHTAAARRRLECLNESPARQLLEEITHFAIHRTF